MSSQDHENFIFSLLSSTNSLSLPFSSLRASPSRFFAPLLRENKNYSSEKVSHENFFPFSFFSSSSVYFFNIELRNREKLKEIIDGKSLSLQVCLKFHIFPAESFLDFISSETNLMGKVEALLNFRCSPFYRCNQKRREMQVIE